MGLEECKAIIGIIHGIFFQKKRQKKLCTVCISTFTSLTFATNLDEDQCFDT